MLTVPVEGGKIMNVVAFVSDRSQSPDERVWNGPWVKPVDHETVLNDFADWNQQALNILEVGTIPFSYLISHS
jgi:salicylate hydroxylase